MLTLSQTTATTRKILKITAILIGTLLSLIIIVRGLFALKELISPTPPPPPTVSFGRLTRIAFPENATQKRLNYTLNTVSGSLPSFPDRLTVNKMNGYYPDILGVDKANQKASGANFPVPGSQISGNNYRWTDASQIQRELTMNILTSDFIMTSKFLDDPTVASAKSLSGPEAAKNAAIGLIQGMQLLSGDIDGSKTATTLLSIDHGALIAATSLASTQIIGVYLFQSDINSLPVFYPKAEQSTMNFLVGSAQFDPIVVGADFSYQAVSTISATYPIKTAEEAYKDLKEGKGYVSTYYGGEEILIKDVFLAYYIGGEKQQYLMPIVVFKGDKGFYSYVSAVKDEWLNN